MGRRLRWRVTARVVLCALILLTLGVASDAVAKRDRKSRKKDRSEPAAVIGDRTITLQELDAMAGGQLMKVRQQEYEVRRKILDTLIEQEVLELEAEATGVSRDQLIGNLVSNMVEEPTQAEIDAYYEQNKALYSAQTKEQAEPRIASLLRSQRMAGARQRYMKSLRERHHVRILIEPPRVAVSVDDDAAQGPADAPVTIVAFSDYQCPYCGRAESIVAGVLEKYGDKIRIVYRDYPLPFHPNAEIASIGAECAEEQGKFWEMHHAMFADQKKLALDDLIETADDLGLDAEEFKACLDSGRYRSEVRKDFQDGKKYGVTGTPTFFINGIMLVGAQGADVFSQIIDQELERDSD